MSGARRRKNSGLTFNVDAPPWTRPRSLRRLRYVISQNKQSKAAASPCTIDIPNGHGNCWILGEG